MSTFPARPATPVRSPSPPRARHRRGSRRVGYVVGAAVNAVLLYLVNVRPGWDAVPFLTEATPLVLGLVNASILVNLVANLVYVVADPPWLTAVGDLVTTGIGLMASVRFWQVWPVSFAAGSPWEVLARLAVALAVFGGLVGVVAAVARLVRALSPPASRA